MTEIFIAKVESQGQIGWMVTPQIINDDGQQHDQIEVVAAGGITPQVGDYVFIQTMKNNLDFSNINQYFKANRANGIIIDIATSADGKYYLTGDYNFKGDFSIDGNLSVSKDVNISENLTITKDLTVNGNGTISGTLSVGGKDFATHTHSQGTYSVAAAPGPVAGVSGAVE